MKKQLRYFILSALAFGLFPIATDAQTKRPTPVKQKTVTATELSGVYAAISVGFYLNNATEINTHTYYFRPNGTFAAELDQPDWKTRVDGKYAINGKIVNVVKNGAKPETIEIQDDGTLKEEGIF